MKRIIVILVVSLFAAGCSLGVPIIDDQLAHDNGNAGGDSDNDRNKPPERDNPKDEQPRDGEPSNVN